MSLKLRLLAAMAIALIVVAASVGVASTLTAHSRIASEMDAARRVAGNAVTSIIAGLAASPAPQRDLARLVQTFNGDRHLRLMLIDAFGHVRFESHLALPGSAAPQIYTKWMTPDGLTQVVPMPTQAAPVVAALIAPVPVNAIASAWSDLVLTLASIAVFFGLASGLMLAVVNHAMRPAGAMISAFHRIGRGDYGTQLEPAGIAEFVSLAAGCNEMAARLGALAQRNQRLSEQLLRLQDEERAELARDLHDDVGPFLFAIDVDAAGIAGLVSDDAVRNALPDPSPTSDGKAAPVAAQILASTVAIREAARHARLQVRQILGTLRPGLLPGLGFGATLEHLVSECRRRHPAIAFTLDIGADEGFGAAIDALLHRVVREAVNNALRHGRPSTIAIRIRTRAGCIDLRIADDGGGWHEGEGGIGGGYGLIGMRERIEAMGGRLDFAEIALPPGLAVTGRIPLPPGDTPMQDAASPFTPDGHEDEAV